MQTLSSTTGSAVVQHPAKKDRTAFWKNIEFNRWGIVTYTILIVACLGGITAGFGTGGNVVELAFVVIPTMMTLAFTLAVAPMRLILGTAVVAVLLDLILFLV